MSVEAPPKPTTRRPAGTVKSPPGRKWPAWVSAPKRLKGRQDPEWWHGAEGDESDGDEASKLGANVGLKPLPWQWWGLRKMLSRRPDGLWTHPDVVYTVARQNGKTLILILRILFGFFVLNETIVYSAQRWLTARDVIKRFDQVLKAFPALAARIVHTEKEGFRKTYRLASGAELQLGVRGGDLGRGLTKVDLVIFDEAYNLQEDEVSALTGAQRASDNPQTIYTSTPAVQTKHPHCQVLADMLRNGEREEEDLFVAVWAAPKPKTKLELIAARNDRHMWAQGNPSLGVVISERTLKSDRMKAKTTTALALFDADTMGWGDYPKAEDERDPVINLDIWRKGINLMPDLVGKRVIAIDRTQDRDLWAIAVAQRTSESKIQGEVGYFDSATAAHVAAYVALIVDFWDPAAVIIDKTSPANVLIPLLDQKEIEVYTATTPDMAMACQGLVDHAEAGLIGHSGQPIMDDAIQVATKHVLPKGDWVWNVNEGTVAQLKAFTLAVFGIQKFTKMNRGGGALPSTGSPSGLSIDRDWVTGHEGGPVNLDQGDDIMDRAF